MSRGNAGRIAALDEPVRDRHDQPTLTGTADEPAMSSRCGASSPDEDGHMSPTDYRQGTDGRPRAASTVGHYCERIRRFTEEDAARNLRSHTRTHARDWAKDHRSTSAAAPILSDAYGRRGTGPSATPLKGTDATASRHVRGTLRGQP